MVAKQRRHKSVPQRTCVVCRQKTDKRHLTRIVRTPDGSIVVDPSGKKAGRGAYLCDRATCWDKALRTDALERGLKVSMSLAEKEVLATHRPHDTIEDTV